MDPEQLDLKYDQYKCIVDKLKDNEKQFFDVNQLISRIVDREYKSNDTKKYYILTIKIHSTSLLDNYYKYLAILIIDDVIVEVDFIKDKRRNILTVCKKIGLEMLFQSEPSADINDICMIHYKSDRDKVWMNEDVRILKELTQQLMKEYINISDNKGYVNNRDLDLIKVIETERTQIIKARIGQERFKKCLLNREQKCSLCNIFNAEFLIASHIKPWKYSNHIERLDHNNGLLLCPNHDALFDKGHISFNKFGNIVLSSKIDIDTFELMGINKQQNVKLNAQQLNYMNWHIENQFKS